MRILKWRLEVTDFQTVMLPAGAEMLTVQMQHDNPQLWALCEESEQREPRSIRIYGTGHPMSEEPHGPYLGTFQLDEGLLVFHAFEVPFNPVKVTITP